MSVSLPQLVDTICASRKHCVACRDLVRGPKLWALWADGVFAMPDACPRGLAMGWTPSPVEVERANRPRPTLRQVRTFALAVATGKYVGDEIREERERICATCEHQRVDDKGVPWCAQCGCGTSNAEKQVRNLAAYEEKLPEWGCKHERREQGAGWRR